MNGFVNLQNFVGKFVTVCDRNCSFHESYDLYIIRGNSKENSNLEYSDAVEAISFNRIFDWKNEDIISYMNKSKENPIYFALDSFWAVVENKDLQSIYNTAWMNRLKN